MDPFVKYLGVSAAADAFRLLALTPGQRHPRAVQQALASQLGRVDHHPDGGSAEANFVRQRLREAARVLLDEPVFAAQAPAADEEAKVRAAAPPAPPPVQPLRPVFEAPPPPPAPTAPLRPVLNSGETRLDLTEFDRHVLAILVACGGWNAASRAKLVETAAEHNVSPPGLMKVVTGLCGLARTRQARLDVAQITQGARRYEQLPPAPMPERPADESVPEQLLPELKEGSTWATIKLSLLFGSVTIMAGLLFLRVLIREGDSSAPPPKPVAQSDQEPVAPFPPGGASQTESQPRAQRILATWQERPTFRGERSPAAAADALDQSPRLPELLDELARKLTVSEAPSAAAQQDWRVFNEQAALIWVQGDRAIVRAVRANVFDVLFAVADRPSAAEEFLGAIAEQAAHLDDPLDIWRGAWAAGILAEVASRADLPAFLRQRAGERLAEVVPGSQPPRTFDESARRWLGDRVQRLVELTDGSASAYNFWELWLSAQSALGRDSQFDAALISAIAGILRTPADLARPGSSVNVLGRLLNEINLSDSSEVRAGVLELFADPEIFSRDLWVLTSLLVQSGRAAWMNESLVVAPDASAELRRNALIHLEKAWPRPQAPATATTEGSGIAVDPVLGERWMKIAREQVSHLARLSQPLERRPELLAQRLVSAAWLNEAALALARGAGVEAERALRMAEAGWTSSAATSPPNQQPGQPAMPFTPPSQPSPGGPGNPSNPGRGVSPVGPSGVPVGPGSPPAAPSGAGGGGVQPMDLRGPDGTWAAAYEAASNNIDTRMEILRSLRTIAGADLGPLDARRLVEEAYRSPVPELRLFAQTIVVELFTRAPTVALELLNQFTEAPTHHVTGQFLQSYLSRTLPEPQASAWRRETRLALLQHALHLMPFPELEIDLLAESLAESYGDRLQLLRPDAAGASSWSDPADALDALIAEWRDQAARLMVSDPVPDSLAAIERRRETRRSLAQGPIERAVAAQVTLLELHAYIAAAEQPVLSGELRSLLERAASQRGESDHVLEQALRTELAITQVWMLRLEIGAAAAEEGGVR